MPGGQVLRFGARECWTSWWRLIGRDVERRSCVGRERPRSRVREGRSEYIVSPRSWVGGSCAIENVDGSLAAASSGHVGVGMVRCAVDD